MNHNIQSVHNQEIYVRKMRRRYHKLLLFFTVEKKSFPCHSQCNEINCNLLLFSKQYMGILSLTLKKTCPMSIWICEQIVTCNVTSILCSLYRCLLLLWKCIECFCTSKWILFHKWDYRNFECLAISINEST